MCNLYSITTNQAAIIALFRVINRCVGNLPPMPGVFPDYSVPVVGPKAVTVSPVPLGSVSLASTPAPAASVMRTLPRAL